MSDHHQDPDAPNPLVSAVAHHMHLEDPDAPHGPATGPPTDPGSGGMRFLAWLVLIVAVGFTVWAQWLGPAPAPVAQTEMSPPGGLMRIAGRYAVGSKSVLDSLASSQDADAQADLMANLAEQADTFATTPEDRFRTAIVRAELLGPDAAIEALAALETDLYQRDEKLLPLDYALERVDAAQRLLLDQFLPEGLASEFSLTEEKRAVDTALVEEANDDRVRIEALRFIQSGALDEARELLEEVETELRAEAGPLRYPLVLRTDVESVRDLLLPDPIPPADPDTFRERHGWFADLALAQGLDDENPARRAVLAKGERTFITAVVGILLFAGLAFVGFVLGIIAIVLIATRKLKAAYRPHAPGGSVYLEVFALFILGFLGVSFASEAIYNATGADYSRLLIWLLLLVPFWALIRGARASDFRNAMGWHAGKGLFREIGAGIVGYIACIPIFLAGIALTLLMMFLSALLQGGGEEGGGGAGPTHPILDQVDPHNLWSVLGVYAVAALWAPIVEESLFRGALYHHLRGRLHPLLAGLGVAFIFAVIHPQGWIAVPALMSLAVNFALLREWRGSLIAPVVGHAIHNGALMTALVLALS